VKLELPSLRAQPRTDAESSVTAVAVESPVRTIAWQAAGMWLGTRAAYIVFTYFAVPFNHQHAHGAPSRTEFKPDALLNHWWRWDAQWYTNIAVHGYHPGRSTGFFPLYPALVHVVVAVIGYSHVIGAAVLVANLAALPAFIGVGLLAADVYGRPAATFAVRALAAFPTAFFLAAGYSESLFLALAVFCLYFARREQWGWAALCAFLASFDRQFGIVLTLPMLWEWVSRQRQAGRTLREMLSLRALAEAVPLLAAVPVALLIWGAYLDLRFGDPLATLNAQRVFWHHELVPPWQWLQLVGTAIGNTPPWSFLRVRIFFDLAPVVGLILVALLAFRRWPVSLALYTLGMIALLVTSAVPLDYDPFNAEGRYVLLVIPLFLLLGRWMVRRPWLEMLLVGGGFMLQALFLGFFLRGGWLV
jgi:hypothetical protein